jgi:hypothetical protein
MYAFKNEINRIKKLKFSFEVEERQRKGVVFASILIGDLKRLYLVIKEKLNIVTQLVVEG